MIRIITGYKNTKIDEEDLAITPYLFLVKTIYNKNRILGLGICWIHFSFYIAIGKINKKIPFFINHKNLNNK